jgi:bifunctional DNA-binding transcriptional regulator/antitoxin component of YhaV-PrlF toxin-antitoxin module
MSLLKIEDGSNIKLPEDVVERLGLRKGDIVSVRVEGNRIILEKRDDSPVDASFGIWSDTPRSSEYVDNLRDKWERHLDSENE